MLIVIVTSIATSFLRLDQDSSFKQNLFEHMTKNYRNTLEFSVIFTLFNFYVFILAFAYSPAKSAAIGKIYG